MEMGPTRSEAELVVGSDSISGVGFAAIGPTRRHRRRHRCAPHPVHDVPEGFGPSPSAGRCGHRDEGRPQSLSRSPNALLQLCEETSLGCAPGDWSGPLRLRTSLTEVSPETVSFEDSPQGTQERSMEIGRTSGLSCAGCEGSGSHDAALMQFGRRPRSEALSRCGGRRSCG